MRKDTIERTKMILNTEIEHIRNISVIAHVDHGKTTLVDSLLSKSGFLKDSNAGKMRVLDTKEEEQERQITIKSTGISLLVSHFDKEFVFNVVDSPGHVDFSSEVSAALRITDGGVIVVDCVEGVCVQTETVMRQAMEEKVTSVLHINKVDRLISELDLNEEQIYTRFREVVEQVNVVLSTYESELFEPKVLDPRIGNVSFGSGKRIEKTLGRSFLQPKEKKIPEDTRN